VTYKSKMQAPNCTNCGDLTARLRIVVWQLTVLIPVLANAVPAFGDNYPVLHLKNPTSLDLAADIATGNPTVTSFQGTNDVTITQLAAPSFYSYFQAEFGGASPGNNPGYLTGFVGSGLNNTGDGSPGRLFLLGLNSESASNQPKLQFDFTIPLDATDRLLISDIDRSEKYKIEAFHFTGSGYQPLSLTGWIHESFSGETGIPPNATWPTWNSGLGTLTASVSTALTEPVDAFTPNQSVDRLIITRLAGGTTADIEIQFISVPEPSPFVLIGLAFICTSSFLVLTSHRRSKSASRTDY
jgi:hypothetical protein